MMVGYTELGPDPTSSKVWVACFDFHGVTVYALSVDMRGIWTVFDECLTEVGEDERLNVLETIGLETDNEQLRD